MDDKLIKLLIEDVEYKRDYTARYDLTCYLCGNEIAIGDKFYFFGDSHKVCNACHHDIIDQLGGF